MARIAQALTEPEINAISAIIVAITGVAELAQPEMHVAERLAVGGQHQRIGRELGEVLGAGLEEHRDPLVVPTRSGHAGARQVEVRDRLGLLADGRLGERGESG